MGIATRLGVPLGWVVIGVGSLVMLAWIPLKQRPGVGTASNAIVVGPAVNGALGVLPALGPGPRDGLMTGIAARGQSLRAVRTLLEPSVLAVGVALGGPSASTPGPTRCASARSPTYCCPG
jgi:uncharacterized membrane protein YczE